MSRSDSESKFFRVRAETWRVPGELITDGTLDALQAVHGDKVEEVELSNEQRGRLDELFNHPRFIRI